MQKKKLPVEKIEQDELSQMEVKEGGLGGQACVRGNLGNRRMSALPIKLAVFRNAAVVSGRGTGRFELKRLAVVHPLCPDSRSQCRGGVLAVANPGIRSADDGIQYIASKVFQSVRSCIEKHIHQPVGLLALCMSR